MRAETILLCAILFAVTFTKQMFDAGLYADSILDGVISVVLIVSLLVMTRRAYR